jgi:hypothetical protein
MSEQRDVGDLQSEMRRVRGELGKDVADLIESTRDAMNWHYYVCRYPWACVGAAVLLGYFIVPKSRRPIVHIEQPEAPRPGLGATVKSAVLASAARLAGGLAAQYASRLVDQYRGAPASSEPHEGEE